MRCFERSNAAKCMDTTRYKPLDGMQDQENEKKLAAMRNTLRHCEPEWLDEKAWCEWARRKEARKNHRRLLRAGGEVDPRT
jgi:hypothetical protein